MNSSFIKSFDILFAPYNYLTIGTIFKRFFIPEDFLYQFSKILSLELRTSLPEKTLNTIIFEASPTTSVILFVCKLCDFNFDSILKLLEHKENSHVSCLNSRRSQMTQRLIHCRLCDLKAKSSAALHEHTTSCHMKSDKCNNLTSAYKT